MTAYFVTRHPGAAVWAAQNGHANTLVVSHLDPSMIRAGDTVLGTLPINLVAQINAIGARYFHLVLDLSPELRGKELSADMLDLSGAKLIEYTAKRGAEHGPTN